MPTVQDVLTTKGREVYTTDPTIAVLDAVRKMNQHKLGALVVIKGDQLVGIFTERDVLCRVVGEQRNPREITVGEVMTREITCVPPTIDLDEVSSLMQQRRIRHIPVLDDDGKLLGLISIGDVNAFHASHQEAQITFLNEYIYGRA